MLIKFGNVVIAARFCRFQRFQKTGITETLVPIAGIAGRELDTANNSKKDLSKIHRCSRNAIFAMRFIEFEKGINAMKIILTGILIMDLISYAKTFIGTRYKWGADGGGAFDCSGFIQEVLACEGRDPKGDQTAQALYNEFKKLGNGSGIQKRSLLFFGTSTERITHVALAIGHSQMIESGGGNSKTVTEDDAIRANAMVRIRPILSRKDLVAAIKLPEKEFYAE